MVKLPTNNGNSKVTKFKNISCLWLSPRVRIVTNLADPFKNISCLWLSYRKTTKNYAKF